jgi:hypothetical protein
VSGWDRIRKAARGRWLSEEEHIQGIRDGVDSLKRAGMMPRDADPRGEPAARFDTGHYVDSVLGPEDGNWTTYISHDADPSLHRTIAIEHGDLGGDHSGLADRLGRALRRPEVMQSMREQMQHGDDPEPRWHRRYDFS